MLFKPYGTFIQHVLDEIKAGRYLKWGDRSFPDTKPSMYGAAFSPNANKPGRCDWMITSTGSLSRSGESVRVTWREGRALRKARDYIYRADTLAWKKNRDRLRDWP